MRRVIYRGDDLSLEYVGENLLLKYSKHWHERYFIISFTFDKSFTSRGKLDSNIIRSRLLIKLSYWSIFFCCWIFYVYHKKNLRRVRINMRRVTYWPGDLSLCFVVVKHISSKWIRKQFPKENLTQRFRILPFHFDIPRIHDTYIDVTYRIPF